MDPNKLVGVFGADAVRYFVLREIPFGYDGDYSDASAILRFNSDLVNDFSNLVHRVVKWADVPSSERMIGRPTAVHVTEGASAVQTTSEPRDVS